MPTESKCRISISLLNTRSGDEVLLGNTPTNLNTKKLKNNFFCAQVGSTFNPSLSSGHTNAPSITVGSGPCANANPIPEESQIPPEEQLSQLEIEQETWFLQTLTEYYKKIKF